MKSLPIGWSEARIGEIVVGKVAQGEPTETVAYVDIGSIDRDAKRIGQTTDVTPANAPSRARQWVRASDVLVSMTRPNLNAVAIVPPDLDGALASTGFDVLRAQGVMPQWLFNRVRTQEFVLDVCKTVQGVVYPAIRPDDVRQHRLPVPPLAEQQRIVEAIESHLSRLDAAVASLERVQAKLKAYRASVLKAAVEGRLVPTEAELARREGRAYEPAAALLARVLAERRRRWEDAELAKLAAAGKKPKNDRWKTNYREPAEADVSKLPTLPEGWCWTSLGALIVTGPQNGIYVPRNRYGDGTSILRIDDYQFGWSRSATALQQVSVPANELAKFALCAGDVVLNRVNSPSHLGKTMVVEGRHLPSVFESNMMRFHLGEDVSPHFLQFWLSSPHGRQSLIAGAKWAVNQASINQHDVGSTPVPLPPALEQARIVAEVDRALTTGTSTAEHANRTTLRCARLRQAVLKWAYEGKLVDQHPADEPAEVLLARIRAERAAAAPTKNARSRKVKGAVA